MNKIRSKQMITAALFTAVVGLSGAPLNAGAVGNDDNRNNSSWNRDDHRRIISEWQARRIAQNVFPRKHIVRVVLTSDNNRRHDDNRWNNNNSRVYIVRFSDGSRVDVRARDGRVVFVDNNSRRHSFNDWR